MATLVAIGYPDEVTAEAARQTVAGLEDDLIIQADQVAAIRRDTGRQVPHHDYARRRLRRRRSRLGRVLGPPVRPDLLHSVRRAGARRRFGALFGPPGREGNRQGVPEPGARPGAAGHVGALHDHREGDARQGPSRHSRATAHRDQDLPFGGRHAEAPGGADGAGDGRAPPHRRRGARTGAPPRPAGSGPRSAAQPKEEPMSAMREPARLSGEGIPGDVQRALDDVNVPSYAIDRFGVIRWLNPAGLKLLGDVRGRQQSSVVAAGAGCARPGSRSPRKLLGKERSTDASVVVLGSDGERLQVDISSVPLHDGGRIVGVFGIVAHREDTTPPGPHPHLTPRQNQVPAPARARTLHRADRRGAPPEHRHRPQPHPADAARTRRALANRGAGGGAPRRDPPLGLTQLHQPNGPRRPYRRDHAVHRMRSREAARRAGGG